MIYLSFESISNSLSHTLGTQLPQNTTLWIILAGVIGGIITQVLKFVFENTLPEWQRRKATKIAIQKYSQPVTQSTSTLFLTINNILKDPSSVTNSNEKLAVLYSFGSLLGWIQILLNESFFEGIETPGRKNYKGMLKYQYDLAQFFSGISYDYHFRRPLPEVTRPITVPRHALSAIGELMIDKTTKGKDSFQKVISIIDFSINYQESAEFKKWFAYLDNILFMDIDRNQVRMEYADHI